MIGVAVEQLSPFDIRELLDALPAETVRQAYLGGHVYMRLDTWSFDRLQDAIRTDDGRRCIDLIAPIARKAAS